MALSSVVALLKSSTVFPCTQLWNHSTSGYHLVKEYPCTPVLFGNNLQSFVWPKLQSFVWSKCPLSDINPSNACGPDAPAPFDNRSHVAVVLCRNKDCSIEEKANNLGQANYVAFITSDDHNCSGGEWIDERSCVMRYS